MPHPSGRPWILAHRGARLVAPENTTEAFREAARLGADAVEFDVRRSADGSLVVHHDAILGASDSPIIELGFTEIRHLAPHIPTLSEALEACEGMWVDIEVKNYEVEPDWDPRDVTVESVARLVDALGVRERVLVSSFNRPTVDRAAQLGFRTGWLLGRTVDPTIEASRWPTDHAIALPPLSSMGPGEADRIVSAFAAIDVEVGVWTVNEGPEISRLAAAGVGLICTDDVETAVAVCQG